jgi:5'-nucleotidase
MNRRIFIRNLGIGGAGIAMAGLTPAFASDDFIVVTILHTNDIHSHVEPFSGSNPEYEGKGGLARISGLIKNIKDINPNTLVLDAGDAFQGTPYFNFFGGEFIYKLMSAAGYDATTIGNHEFDNKLQGLYNALPMAEFPVINSNYDFSDTILSGKFPRWKIYKKSGIKIGVYGIGIELEGLVARSHYGNTKYLNPITTANEMERFLRNEENCDLVVCLSHQGHSYRDNRFSDLDLAAETLDTDLFISGHTHFFIREPAVVKNKAGNPVIVNLAWWGGLVLGQIDFTFKRETRKREKIIARNQLDV